MAETKVTKDQLYQDNIFANLSESAKTAEAQILQLNKQLAEQVKLVNKMAGKLGTNAADVDKLTKSYRETKTALNEYQKAEQQIARLRERGNLVTNEQRLELEKLKIAQQQANREARETVKYNQLLSGSYDKLVADTRKAQQELKELAAKFGVNSEEAQAAAKRFDLLDGKLREINKSAKDGRGDVGRYADEIGGLLQKFSGSVSGGAAGMLGGLANIGSSIPIIGGVVAAVGGIGTAVYNVNKEFDTLRNEIEKATGSIGQDLDDLTVSFAALENVFDADRSELLLSARVLKNTFDDIKDQDIARLLEQGFLSSADATGEMMDSVREYSVQIKAAGGDAEDLFKILDASGKVGIYSDKGIDTVKEFGLRIREQTNATREALENAFGKGFSDTLLKGVNDGSISTLNAIQMVSAELDKIPETSSAAQTVIADVFGGPGEDAGIEFLKTLKDINFETKFYADENNKLTDINRQRLDIEKQIAAVQNDISKEIGENSQLGLIWQKVVLGLNSALLWLVQTANELIETVTTGFSSVESFFKMMASFVPVVGDIIVGVEDSTRALTEQQKAIRAATKEIQQHIKAGKQEISVVHSLTRNLGTQNISRETQVKNILKLQKMYPDIIKGYTAENLAQADLLKVKKDLLTTFTEEFIIRRKNYAQTLLQAEVDRAINEGRNQAYIANIQKIGEARIAMFEKELRIQLGLQEREKEIQDQSVEDQQDALDKKTSATGAAVDAEKAKLDELNEFKRNQDIRLKEFENNLRKQGAYDEQLVNDFRLQLARETSQKIIDLDFKEKDILIENENERLKLAESSSLKRVRSEAERIEKEKKAEQDMSWLAEARFEKQKTLIDKYKDDIAEAFKLLSELEQRRIAEIDRRIEGQQRLYDDAKSNEEYLIDLAKTKSLNVTEAIKEEREAQRQALAEQEALERKKQRTQAYIAALNALSNGQTVAEIGDQLAQVKSLVEAYFIDGTETTVGDQLGYKSKVDGHYVAVDSREAIFNPAKTKALGIGPDRTTSDVVDIVQAFDNGMLYNRAFYPVSVADMKQLQQANNDYAAKAMLRVMESVAINTAPENQPKESIVVDAFAGVINYMRRTKTAKTTRKINLK